MADNDDHDVWPSLWYNADIGRIIDEQPDRSNALTAFVSFGLVVFLQYIRFILRYLVAHLFNPVLNWVSINSAKILDQQWIPASVKSSIASLIPESINFDSIFQKPDTWIILLFLACFFIYAAWRNRNAAGMGWAAYFNPNYKGLVFMGILAYCIGGKGIQDVWSTILTDRQTTISDVANLLRSAIVKTKFGTTSLISFVAYRYGVSWAAKAAMGNMFLWTMGTLWELCLRNPDAWHRIPLSCAGIIKTILTILTVVAFWWMYVSWNWLGPHFRNAMQFGGAQTSTIVVPPATPGGVVIPVPAPLPPAPPAPLPPLSVLVGWILDSVYRWGIWMLYAIVEFARRRARRLLKILLCLIILACIWVFRVSIAHWSHKAWTSLPSGSGVSIPEPPTIFTTANTSLPGLGTIVTNTTGIDPIGINTIGTDPTVSPSDTENPYRPTKTTASPVPDKELEVTSTTSTTSTTSVPPGKDTGKSGNTMDGDTKPKKLAGWWAKPWSWRQFPTWGNGESPTSPTSTPTTSTSPLPTSTSPPPTSTSPLPTSTSPPPTLTSSPDPGLEPTDFPGDKPTSTTTSPPAPPTYTDPCKDCYQKGSVCNVCGPFWAVVDFFKFKWIPKFFFHIKKIFRFDGRSIFKFIYGTNNADCSGSSCWKSSLRLILIFLGLALPYIISKYVVSWSRRNMSWLPTVVSAIFMLFYMPLIGLLYSSYKTDTYYFFFLLCLGLKTLKIIPHFISYLYLSAQPSIPRCLKFGPTDYTAIIPITQRFSAADQAAFETATDAIVRTGVRLLFVTTEAVMNEAERAAFLTRMTTGSFAVAAQAATDPPATKRQLIAFGIGQVDDTKTIYTCVLDPFVTFNSTFLSCVSASFAIPHTQIVGSTRHVVRDKNDMHTYAQSFKNYNTINKMQRLDFDNTAAWNIDGGIGAIPGNVWFAQSSTLKQSIFSLSLVYEDYFGETATNTDVDYLTARHFTKINDLKLGWVHMDNVRDRPVVTLPVEQETMASLQEDADRKWRNIWTVLFKDRNPYTVLLVRGNWTIYVRHLWFDFYFFYSQVLTSGLALEFLALYFWYWSIPNRNKSPLDASCINFCQLVMLYFWFKFCEREMEREELSGLGDRYNFLNWVFAMTIWPFVEAWMEARAAVRMLWGTLGFCIVFVFNTCFRRGALLHRLFGERMVCP